MLFQAKVINDIELNSNVDETGKFRFRTTKYTIPAGTIVDVYGISSYLSGAGPSTLLVVYHNSLPHLFTITNMFLRPL